MADNITLQEIESAQKLVHQYLIKTPLIYNHELSEATGNKIFLKLENFQYTHSFKVRGSLNKVFNLSQSERECGVIAASSGNHALGVAYSSRLFGLETTVIMPSRAPQAKINLAKKYGAKVVLHGDTYDDALIEAQKIANDCGKVLLPSFNDLKIIAGQSTIALEVLENLPDVQYFLAPIGGGGLASGLLTALNLVGHNASVIGIEAEGAASMLESIRGHKRVKLPRIETIADGIAVQEPGAITYEIVKAHIKDIITVTDNQILDAMRCLLLDVGIVVEPAAAASVAALLFSNLFHNLGKTICCVITGGNVSRSLFQKVVAGIS